MYLYKGKIGFQFGNGASLTNYVASGGNTLYDGQWHFVVVTFNRGSACGTTGTLIFYQDGVAVHTQSNVPAGNLINNVNLFIGERQTPYGSNSFNGDIDELVIFKKVLSPAKISDLYTEGSTFNVNSNIYYKKIQRSNMLYTASSDYKLKRMQKFKTYLRIVKAIIVI